MMETVEGKAEGKADGGHDWQTKEGGKIQDQGHKQKQ